MTSYLIYSICQVLETDIDGPSSPDIQPPPPPRRSTNNYNYSKPPPKPPKLSPPISQQEINHNDLNLLSATNLNEPSNYVNPYNERIEQSTENLSGSPKLQHKTSVNLPVRDFDIKVSSSLSPARQVQATKARGRSESMISPKGEDLTVTSGDPTAHLNRRHSVGKARSRRSASTASSTSKDEGFSIDSQKASPGSRLHQRETEFSAIERPVPVVAERLQPHVINNAIHENRPKPFDRYYADTHGSCDTLNNHSRQPSSELLGTGSIEGSNEMLHSETPATAPRIRERKSPIPARRSPKSSPVILRSTRTSMGRYVQWYIYRYSSYPFYLRVALRVTMIIVGIEFLK